MKTSSTEKVRELYENTADSYAAMMDTEINLSVYSDTLGRLAERIANVPGPVLDTSCGTGHMLSRYRERYDSERWLVGIDLSPRMVALAGENLESVAETRTGDMRDLHGIEDDSMAAVLSFFAIHHLDREDVQLAFREWCRVLAPGGQLVVAAWEGVGLIDYGGETDVLALRYTMDEITACAEATGFAVDRCVVEPVEGMPMKGVYLEGTRP